MPLLVADSRQRLPRYASPELLQALNNAVQLTTLPARHGAPSNICSALSCPIVLSTPKLDGSVVSLIRLSCRSSMFSKYCCPHQPDLHGCMLLRGKCMSPRWALHPASELDCCAGRGHVQHVALFSEGRHV